MCYTRRCRQPTSDGRKKVFGRGKFSRASADCPPGFSPESSQWALQLVEAISAALRDPFLELVVLSSCPFWPNARNRKAAQRCRPPSQEGSKRVPLYKPSRIQGV